MRKPRFLDRVETRFLCNTMYSAGKGPSPEYWFEAVHTVLIGTCRLSTHGIPTLVDFTTFFWLGPFLQSVALYGLLQLRISQSLQQYAGLHSF